MADQTIWKFQFRAADSVEVLMPGDAILLHAEINPWPTELHQIDIWAAVNPTWVPVTRRFAVRRSGRPVDQATLGGYFATVREGPFVWHIFDLGYPGRPLSWQCKQGDHLSCATTYEPARICGCKCHEA